MRRRNGFTLIELLVVIAIIAILAAIIFPVYAQAKKGAYKSSDISNMNTLRTALQLYRTDQGAFPPALLGYVGPYQDQYHTNNLDASGANVLPPNSIKAALYPKRVESLSVFRPALDRIADNAPAAPYDTTAIENGTHPLVTSAYWPQGVLGNSSNLKLQKFGPGQIVQRAFGQGSACQVVNNYYYKISGYDVAPVNPTSTRMESHYQLFWTGYTVPTNPCSPTTDEQGSAADDTRQLGYNDPPETTVVTWNSFFRDYQNGAPIHQKQDLVLFLAGNARPMDSANVASQAWAVTP